MKKSSGVPATLIATLAAGIVSTGCGSGDHWDGGRDVCLDAQNNVVDPSNCRSGRTGMHWIRSGGYGGIGDSNSSYGG